MTRVLDYGDESNYDTGRGSAAAWAVYRRLLGYALAHRLKLATTLFFSVVVAVSFTSILVSAGASISILFDDEAQVDATLANIAEKIRDTPGVPEQIAERFVAWAKGLRHDTGRTVTYLAAALVILSLIGGAARFLQEYLAGAIGASISVKLNREMFSNLVTLSHEFYDGKTTGEVVARFTNDALMVNKGLTSVLVKLFREPVRAFFFLAVALSVDWVLTGVVLLVIPPVALVMRYVGRTVRRSARRSLQKVAAMAGVVHETVSGISVIKSFRMERYEEGRIGYELTKLRRYLIRMTRADAAVGPLTEFLMVLGIAAFLILSERRVSSEHLSIGALSLLFGALAAMLDPMRKLATVNNMIQTSVASAERVFEFIDRRSEVVEQPGARDIAPLSQSLRFEGVQFSYDGQNDVLHGIDFEVAKGEMVALVGFSGAGKSTIAKLIPRFYDPVAGRITIDGTDIRQASLASLRDQISVVTQDTVLFNESVKVNIAFGQDRFTDERIRDAARAAHATEFIEALPEGYQTPLGEGGGRLSGGQRQRLAIARAIIKDPAILILDEATSSLDSESERAIQQAISDFVVGRTTVVIAHRLSTIMRADRILVIDDGRVAEAGTHEELLARAGLYRRLYSVQFGPGKEDSPS